MFGSVQPRMDSEDGRLVGAAFACALAATLALAASALQAPLSFGAEGAAGLCLLGAALSLRNWAVTVKAAAQTARGSAARAESTLQRWQEALDELPSGLEIYDAEDRLIFFNRQMSVLYPWIDFQANLGQTFEHILRVSINDGRVPSAIGREEAWLAERLALRGTRDGPILQSLRSGAWINTYERRSASNFVVGVRLEVTELVASGERLQAIIGSAAVGIVSTDDQGFIVEANAAAADLFGSTAASLCGLSLSAHIPQFAVVPPEGIPPQRPPRGLAWRREVDGLTVDGKRLRLQVSVSGIGTEGGGQYVVVIADLTELKQAEHEWRLLEEQLRESQKLEAIGTLASGIAHDFNNVLGAIVGNAHLAQAYTRSGESRMAVDSLNLIGKSAQRARELVRQILTFARRGLSQRSCLALQPIVEDTLKILHATLPANVVLDVQLEAEPVYALVDAIQIEQVVINLCTNAWQAMGSQGGIIQIGLRALPMDAEPDIASLLSAGPHALLWVADDGHGMDDATRERAFEPFFTTKPAGKGSGLGLSVVHGILKSHEGTIRLKTEPRRGTRFDVFLPAVGAPEPKDLPVAVQPVDATGHGERVLYLDDDDVMPLMVERLLQRAGYVVHCFSDPTLAVEAVRVRPEHFDVVVTDFNMPALSGLDVIEALQTLCPSIPTVLTSGTISEGMRARASALGVREVFEKEYTLEQLPVAIRRALSPKARAPSDA